MKFSSNDVLTGRYLSPEPLLQSPAYVRRMAQAGMSVPTYAYAANNPLKYIDPDGRELSISNYTYIAAWLGGREKELQALREAVERLNRPVCTCARDKVTGHADWPWANRDIELVVGGIFPLGSSSGMSDPISGQIFLNWETSAGQYAGTIAHEAGHFWPPYLGGPSGDFNSKYGTSHTRAPWNYGAAEVCGASQSVQDQWAKDEGCSCAQ